METNFSKEFLSIFESKRSDTSLLKTSETYPRNEPIVFSHKQKHRALDSNFFYIFSAK